METPHERMSASMYVYSHSGSSMSKLWLGAVRIDAARERMDAGTYVYAHLGSSVSELLLCRMGWCVTLVPGSKHASVCKL